MLLTVVVVVAPTSDKLQTEVATRSRFKYSIFNVASDNSFNLKYVSLAGVAVCSTPYLPNFPHAATIS